ncbi:hypothetical protein D6783_02850, partial [Candidatus Woesearchaeota archaeon]
LLQQQAVPTPSQTPPVPAPPQKKQPDKKNPKKNEKNREAKKMNSNQQQRTKPTEHAAYCAPSTGHYLVCTFHNVPETILANTKQLHNLLLEGLAKDRFTILKSATHEFTPQGFTSMVLLAESHACIHTYPEHHSITFSLYSCRGERDGQGCLDYLTNALRAERRIIFDSTVHLNTAHEDSSQKDPSQNLTPASRNEQ